MRYLAILFLLSGCATGYVESNKNGSGFGYRVSEIPADSGIPFYTHLANYFGNSSTSTTNAKAYTRYAALEHCLKQDKKMIIFTKSIDQTKTYRASRLGVTSNGGLYNYNSYKTYPSFSVAFRCDTEFKNFPQQATFNKIKPELLKNFVSDFKGGVQLENVKSAGVFRSDDVLLRVNGQRVLNLAEIYEAISKVDGISASVELIRNKKIIKRQVTLTDNIAYFDRINEMIKKEYCSVESSFKEEADNCYEDLSKKVY